jgi:hypothetical protein
MTGSPGPGCGHPAQPGARFCPVCGQPAGAAGAPALPPPSGPPRPLPPPAADTQWVWDAPPAPGPAAPPYQAPPSQALPYQMPPYQAPYQPQPPYGQQGPGASPYGGPGQGAAGPGFPQGPGTMQAAGGWQQAPGGTQAPASRPGSGGWPQGPGGGGWPQGPSDMRRTLPQMPAIGGPGDPGPGGGGPRRRLPRGPLVPAIATGALIVVVAAIIVAGRGSGQGTGTAAPGAAPGAGATGAAAPAALSAAAREQQARKLAGVLAQNSGDRAAVDNAYYAASACRDLAADQRVFTADAAKREVLVARLAALDHSALSPAMIADLSGGWQASAQADADYARWAASLEGHCRPASAASSPAYLAADGPDATATRDKIAFTRLWNPLARQYGLTTYSYSQL